jgi:RNA polymerase sigma factor (sigma-70 family)
MMEIEGRGMTGNIEAIAPMHMSKEEAGELVDKNIKRIKKIIKSKLGIYPLDFKAVFRKFLDEIKVNGFEMIRAIPVQYTFEAYLESLIKKALIKESYFKLAEECIGERIRKELNTQGKYGFTCLEIIDFVTTRIEKNNLEPLNKFREEAGFKTFLISIVSIQIANYWRDHYRVKNKIEKYGLELSEQYNIDRNDPLIRLIRFEAEEIKGKITDVLAAKRQEVDSDEWVAFEMFYYEGMSWSAIARTFDTTEYKVKKKVYNLRDGIIAEILRKVK